MNNQSMKLFIGLFVIIVFILSANLISGLVSPHKPGTAPGITPVPVEFQSPRITVSQTFPFESTEISLSIPVNVSVLESTKTAGKKILTDNNDPGSQRIADGYRSMVTDPSQEQMFSDLLKELHNVRRTEGLSDDEFLELMVVYVQSFRYESLEQNPVKFPVQTVVDGAGDCDDRSLLLAGLLAREGYSVALLSFEPEAHMAIGVGSSDYLYKKTGYAFIETTNYSFIGVPTDKLGGNLTLYSDPAIIIVSNGTKLYNSGNETRYIHDIYLESEQKVTELASKLKNLNDDLVTKRMWISELNSRINELKNSSDIQAYNSQVQIYTTLVSIYNNRLDSYRQISGEYEKYVDISNYIFDHKFDRKGVYEYIKKNNPF